MSHPEATETHQNHVSSVTTAEATKNKPGGQMSDRALTWSGKWHIVNPDPPAHANRYNVALCGTYVYRDDDPQYPEHLTRIKAGTKKSAGDCKSCARSAGVRTPEQILAAVRGLHDRWAKSETWDGKPDIVSHAYADQLAQALGARITVEEA